MKCLAVVMMMVVLSGCGAADRALSKLTGSASEVCQDGVVYLQFTSGVSVKYTRDGKIANCVK